MVSGFEDLLQKMSHFGDKSFREVWRGWWGAVFEKGEIVREGFGMRVWKAIINEWAGIKSRSHFTVGNERGVKLWKVLWCEDLPLKEVFPNLFSITSNKDGWVAEAWE